MILIIFLFHFGRVWRANIGKLFIARRRGRVWRANIGKLFIARRRGTTMVEYKTFVKCSSPTAALRRGTPTHVPRLQAPRDPRLLRELQPRKQLARRRHHQYRLRRGVRRAR
jgi:hypothetical protein